MAEPKAIELSVKRGQPEHKHKPTIKSFQPDSSPKTHQVTWPDLFLQHNKLDRKTEHSLKIAPKNLWLIELPDYPKSWNSAYLR